MKTNNDLQTIDKVRDLILGNDLQKIQSKIAQIEQNLLRENLELRNLVRTLENKIREIEKTSFPVEVGKYNRVILQRKNFEL